MNFSSKIAIKTSWQSFSVESYAWTSQSSRITLIFINFLWSLRLVWTAQLFPQNWNVNLKISVNFFYLFKISVGFSWTKQLMWKASVLHHTFMRHAHSITKNARANISQVVHLKPKPAIYLAIYQSRTSMQISRRSRGTEKRESILCDDI